MNVTFSILSLPTSTTISLPEIVGYKQPSSHRQEVGYPGRKVTGSYSWTTPKGETIIIEYEADEQGFRILSQTPILKNAERQEVNQNQTEPLANNTKFEENPHISTDTGNITDSQQQENISETTSNSKPEQNSYVTTDAGNVTHSEQKSNTSSTGNYSKSGQNQNTSDVTQSQQSFNVASKTEKAIKSGRKLHGSAGAEKSEISPKAVQNPWQTGKNPFNFDIPASPIPLSFFGSQQHAGYPISSFSVNIPQKLHSSSPNISEPGYTNSPQKSLGYTLQRILDRLLKEQIHSNTSSLIVSADVTSQHSKPQTPSVVIPMSVVTMPMSKNTNRR